MKQLDVAELFDFCRRVLWPIGAGQAAPSAGCVCVNEFDHQAAAVERRSRLGGSLAYPGLQVAAWRASIGNARMIALGTRIALSDLGNVQESH